MSLEIITAPSLAGVQHGFFTRRGGASSGIFSGLNCGPGSSDQAEAVRINRGRVAQSMSIAPDRLLSLHQVHSPDVVTVDGTEDWNPRPRADGLVTSTPGLAISILTADCAPVLFADRDASVIGAAHAGWKGALAGITDAVIAAMAALGAERQRIRAVIGPTISQRAYEVGPEFMDRFLDEDEAHARFFAGGRGDRLQFDLPGFLLHRLREAGIADAAWTGHCTFSDPARFYSYRRATHAHEPDYGRLIAVIRL